MHNRLTSSENNDQDIGSAPGEQRMGWMSKSFKICKIFGIEIHIHALLPLFLIVTLFMWLPMMSQDSQNIGWYILLAFLFNVSLWETVLIHELGHCLAGYLIGGHTDKVLLWPLGGLAFTQPPSVLNNAIGDTQRRKHQIIIALGGPLTHIPHLILYAVLLLSYCSTATPYFPSTCPYGLLDGRDPFKAWIFWKQTIITNCDGEGGLCFWYNFLMLSFMMNFWLFIVNLFVPAFPLDGSRVFINCLLNKYNEEKSAKVYCWISGFIAAVSIVVGVTLFRSNTVLLFVGVWAAFQVYQMVMYLRNGDPRHHPLFR
eukprot:194298_1